MKILKIGALIIVLLGAVVILTAWMYLKSLLPDVEGELVIPDLQNEVLVIRDKFGVPHIYADNDHDLYFALGYVQAQDRIFQMDFYRRAATGTLSEALGKDLIDADVYLRTMGFTRSAAEQLKHLTPTLQEMVISFSEGINYYIEHESLPVEFALLGSTPRPWKPEDSLAIGNLLTFQLASWAYQNEMLNYLLQQKLGAKAKQLLPVYPSTTVSIIGSREGHSARRMSQRSKLFLNTYIKREFASNNWVVSGKLTDTGKPILCEDSHEDGPELPTQWHMAHLVGKDINTTGAMFPGAPIFIWGHNERIAWGLTNFNLDNQDLYLEKIHPDNPDLVMHRGKWIPLKKVVERIAYKGDDGIEYKEIVIRITPRGPIINEIETDLGEIPFSIRRVGAEEESVARAFYGISTAKNWDDFRRALSHYSAGPQHFVYADREGNIGYIGAGRCPVRRGRGILPQPGWDGKNEWKGYYPYERMPLTYNPAKGYVATANNYPVKGRFPIPLSEYWEPPYRAMRITEMIQSGKKLGVADMKAMHVDVKSAMAAQLVPVILNIIGDAPPELVRYCELLSKWDHRTGADSAATCLYEVFFNQLLYVTFFDELPKELFERLIKDKIAVNNIMVELLTNRRDSIFFDDMNSDNRETCRDAVLRALREAVSYLNNRFGTDTEDWQWGELHQIEFSHVFGSEAMLRPIFNYGPFPFGGDEQTVNRAGFNKLKPYKVSITASIRYIVDFSDLSKSLIVLSSGQSANLLSQHRTDMCDMFLKGEYIPWYNERNDFEEEGKLLKLLPGK